MIPDDVLEGFLLELGLENIDKPDEWFNTSCPLAPYSGLHEGDSDNNPSFGVVQDPDNNRVNTYCHTCGHNSTLEQLIHLLSGYRSEDYTQLSLNLIRAKMGTKNFDFETRFNEPRDTRPEPIEGGLKLYPKVSAFADARAYLKKRGVTQRAARLLSLGYDYQDSRITFPVRDSSGAVYGFSGRTTLLKEDYPTDRKYPKVKDYYGLKKKFLILGEHLWSKEKPVLLVEGLLDVACAISNRADDYFNVGAIMKSKLSKPQVEKLITFGKPVYFLLDNDAAGEVGTFGVFDEKTGNQKILGGVDMLYNHVPVFIPEYPDGYDEPDQLKQADFEKIRRETPVYTGLTTKD